MLKYGRREMVSTPFAGLFITDLLLSGVALGHTGAAFFYEGEYMLNDTDIGRT